MKQQRCERTQLDEEAETPSRGILFEEALHSSLTLLREERFHRIERQVSWLPGLFTNLPPTAFPAPGG